MANRVRWNCQATRTGDLLLRVQYYIGACGQPATKLGEEPCRKPCLTRVHGNVLVRLQQRRYAAPSRFTSGAMLMSLSINHKPTSSVSGGEPAGNELIKNRPSGATSYCQAARDARAIRV